MKQLSQYTLYLLFIYSSSCYFSPNTKNEIPSFDLLLADSTSHFHSEKIDQGHPIILLYFSPDCIHCQKEVEGLLKNIHILKDTRIYLVTNDDFSEMKLFKSYYKLDLYPNLIIGKDYKFSIFNYFKSAGPPCMAIYNDKRHLIAVLKGETSPDTIVKLIRNI